MYSTLLLLHVAIGGIIRQHKFYFDQQNTCRYIMYMMHNLALFAKSHIFLKDWHAYEFPLYCRNLHTLHHTQCSL